MVNKENRKKEPWRIVIGIIAILCIVFMWIKKDIVSIYATTSKENIFPLITTTIVVSLLKVAAIAGAILLFKRIIGKIQKK